MIEFQGWGERNDWLKTVRAVLKGGSTRDGKLAVKVADYVVEQGRARVSKKMQQDQKEAEREHEKMRREHDEAWRGT